MDPLIWGSLLWNLLADVAWQHDSGRMYAWKQTESMDRIQVVYDFMLTPMILIPCPHCRTFYRDYIANEQKGKKFRETLLGSIIAHDLVSWVYQIHGAVNAKLGKPNISKDLFVRRLKCTETLGSAEAAFDLMIIMAGNYQVVPKGTLHSLELEYSQVQKKAWTRFLRSLTIVSPYWKLNATLSYPRVRPEDLDNMQSLVYFLVQKLGQMRNKCNDPVTKTLTFEEAMQRIRDASGGDSK